jgi:hypothetical protein
MDSQNAQPRSAPSMKRYKRGSQRLRQGNFVQHLTAVQRPMTSSMPREYHSGPDIDSKAVNGMIDRQKQRNLLPNWYQTERVGSRVDSWGISPSRSRKSMD